MRGATGSYKMIFIYRGADKSLVQPGRKESRNHVKDARDFNNIETQVVIQFFSPLQGKAPKEIHAILTETLVCFLPGRAKDLSAPCNLIYGIFTKICSYDQKFWAFYVKNWELLCHWSS